MINSGNGFDLGPAWRNKGGLKYAFAFISLFIMLLIIYANSFQGTWQFDDFPHIVDNRNVQIRTLSWSELRQSLDSTFLHKLPRPVAYLSFAVNHFFGGLHVFGYHLINIAVHYLTALFLFLLIYKTLNLPLLKDRYGAVSYPVALLATFFWATSPVQVNAVTYIVQRMTSLVGLAYVAAMYCYVQGRTARSSGARAAFLTLCALSAALAFGTKENAALLPVCLFLYDLLLLQGATRENLKKNLKVIAIPLLILLCLGVIYFAVWGNLRAINYDHWTFTPVQRLLTEARVMIFYITLIIYPFSSR
ncbi:MAG: hypothetical protein Q7I93_03010, partial [Syntrophales bacterium]|nr:hypothetical protein [Syntrophales bacterium]